MARSAFGGGYEDWLLDDFTFGSSDLLALHKGTTILTFWSAPTGGTQYTDLLDINSAPISQLVVTDHQMPRFYGPNNIDTMWADPNIPGIARFLMEWRAGVNGSAIELEDPTDPGFFIPTGPGFIADPTDPGFFIPAAAVPTDASILTGIGSPEGVVAADVGTLYLRTDGGGVALYAKQSGTGTVGWFALSGTSPDPYVPPPPPPPGTLPPRLAEYGFNEGTGLFAYDLSGNNHTLDASNSTTSWSTTATEGAAAAKTQFTGHPGPDAVKTSYTIMFRARREGTWTGYAAMFANPAQGLWIEANAANSYLPSFFCGNGVYAMGTTPMALNVWYHIAVTHDSSGNTKIYIGAAQEGSAVDNPLGVNFGGGNGTWVVAGTAAAASDDSPWGGSVDSLRTFDAVLTQAQIATFMGIPLTAVGVAGGGTGGGTPGSGLWLSGASYTGYPASDLFGTWRGTPTAIAGTWMNDATLPTIKAGGEYAAFNGAMDIGLTPPTWPGWAGEAAGANDSFYEQAFTAMNTLRAGKGTTYVRLWYEFNGTWMSWTVHNDTEAAYFKTAWNRIAAIARARFPGVKLTLGAAAANGYAVSSCWPTATVDALSIDFYNNWPFTTTQAGFDSKIVSAAGANSLENLRQLAYTKGVPVIISEWANCGNPGDGGGGGESTAFIDAMWSWISTNAGSGPGNVLAELYFNGWDQFRLLNIGQGATMQPTTAARYVVKF